MHCTINLLTLPPPTVFLVPVSASSFIPFSLHFSGLFLLPWFDVYLPQSVHSYACLYLCRRVCPQPGGNHGDRSSDTLRWSCGRTGCSRFLGRHIRQSLTGQMRQVKWQFTHHLDWFRLIIHKATDSKEIQTCGSTEVTKTTTLMECDMARQTAVITQPELQMKHQSPQLLRNETKNISGYYTCVRCISLSYIHLFIVGSTWSPSWPWINSPRYST